MAKASKKQLAWRKTFAKCMKRKTKSARNKCLRKGKKRK